MLSSTVDFVPGQLEARGTVLDLLTEGPARSGHQRTVGVPPGTATSASTWPRMAAESRRIWVVLHEAKARRRSRPPGIPRGPGDARAGRGDGWEPTFLRDAGGARRPRLWVR